MLVSGESDWGTNPFYKWFPVLNVQKIAGEPN